MLPQKTLKFQSPRTRFTAFLFILDQERIKRGGWNGCVSKIKLLKNVSATENQSDFIIGKNGITFFHTSKMDKSNTMENEKQAHNDAPVSADQPVSHVKRSYSVMWKIQVVLLTNLCNWDVVSLDVVIKCITEGFQLLLNNLTHTCHQSPVLSKKHHWWNSWITHVFPTFMVFVYKANLTC